MILRLSFRTCTYPVPTPEQPLLGIQMRLNIYVPIQVWFFRFGSAEPEDRVTMQWYHRAMIQIEGPLIPPKLVQKGLAACKLGIQVKASQ
jgi:hypothetical protein